MSIKPSASVEIRSLVAALSAGDEIKREAAIARLAVIGPRATDRLLAAYAAPAATEQTRVEILRIFEGIADPRAERVAREALQGSPALSSAAVGTLRALLNTNDTAAATAALDALVALVADPRAARPLRLLAYEALREMPADVQRRLDTALAEDPDPAVRARAGAPADASAPAEVEWQEVLQGQHAQDPRTLLQAARSKGEAAPLGELHRIVNEARQREREDDRLAAEWRELRGQLHQALAARGSTVALYDLRETFEATETVLPRTFITALHTIGDESCLEGIAAAYARVAGEGWRADLRNAWTAIAGREKASAVQAAVKRIRARWPEAADVLSTTSRTMLRPKTRRRT